jgi:hypothetical protein
MSNVNYSKENVILQAVRTLLVADNGTLTGDVKSIHTYCEDRIIRKKIFTEAPGESLATMEVVSNGGDVGLPATRWFLTVTAIIPMDATNSQDNVSNFAERISILLNKKAMNLNNAVLTKNLRCRLINRLAILNADDEVLKIYKRDVNFELIIGDEILECN